MFRAEELYQMLLAAYGKPRWWSDDPFTVMFQAVLVQNTTWSCVEKTSEAMGDRLHPEYIENLPVEELEEQIRPCGFCKAKHECRARAEANLILAQYDFKLPPLLEDTEIEVILSRADQLVSWINDIKEYALQQAISGKEWTGFKLVEGRSNRRYTDEAAVTQAVTNAGFDPYERKLLGITAMQKLLSKSRFDELLSPYIEKPQGKPTLVPESDKRPVMNNAKTDFMEENDNE